MLKPFLLSQISVVCSFSLSLSRYHTNEGNLKASHDNNLRKHTYISDIVRTKETSCIQEPYRRNKTDSLYATIPVVNLKTKCRHSR